MGIFKLNGIDYMGGGGGGNTNYEELTQLEYDALTEEEKNNGTIYFITDANSNQDGKFQPIIYSEEEREIGVWTDGKPLYEKTYHFNITSSGQTITVAQDLNYIDTLVSMKGIMGNATMLPQGSRGSCSEQIWGTLSNYNLIVFVGSGGDVKTGASHITIQYTKTTDSPGSGQWTPQGVPAHHYSTEEQIVGTWVDGSTLYEKTFITPTISNTSINIDLGFAIDMGVVVHGYYLLNDANGSMISANQWFASSNFSWTHIELNTHLLRCNLTGYTGVGYITIRYTKTTS